MKCPTCRIEMVLDYTGKIRNESYGNWKHGEVTRCELCGLKGLNEQKGIDYYRSEYRTNVPEESDAQAHYDFLGFGEKPPFDVLLDVGAGNGDFLALCEARQKVAVEPGRHHFGGAMHLISLTQLPDDLLATAAVSFNVIEHVIDPTAFVKQIFDCMEKDGTLYLSTPNTEQMLMKFCDDFLPFYYRSQHNWYFTIGSLVNLIENTGFTVNNYWTRQRYGINNFVNWMTQGKPTLYPVTIVDPTGKWGAKLEQLYLGDEIIVEAIKCS